MTRTLNIVTTPIGNYSDITLRALNILGESDYIACEEYKEASKLLRFFDIKKELRSINEHNEKESSEEIFMDIIQGSNVSLISDCGTPMFSDPGSILLQKCIEANIKIEFIGGANSVMSSVILSGFDISRFYYLGFLSPKSDIRKKELMNIKFLEKVFVLIDAPYRLKALLKDIEDIFGNRRVFVAFDITMESEKKFSGTAAEILEQIGEENLKGEFVVIVDKFYKK
ncbi:MAG: 16S rRNA (cytidine(1402)-2'-O)-methyltransferase [bacterium]